MITPALTKNDTRANWLIITFSVVIFLVVASLHPLNKVLGIQPGGLGFNVHVFAMFNAVVNTIVSILLIVALWQVKAGKYIAHRNSMYAAMLLSVLFLVSYVTHHLLAGDTHYGGTGMIRVIYFTLLYSHILLAAIILPFILYTAYRAMTGQYERHKKLAKYTWPLWLYVSVTGPIVYLMISPYYN